MPDAPAYTDVSYPDDTHHVYFGHPVDTFGTGLEADLLDRIDAFCAEAYEDYEIINPADAPHPENYEHWKAEHGEGMTYYTEEVLPHMDAGIFLPFEDGTYGAGMAAEVAALISDLDGKHTFAPVYEIDRDGTITELLRPLTPEETGERLG